MRWLDESSFATHKGAAGGLRNPCRTCSLVSKYGITRNEYEQMVTAQDGKCPICGDRPRVLVVDHDHSCCPANSSCGGCIRSLLCGRCNSGLGLFRDRPELLRSAANYLAG
jgi:hypothetical protein